MMNLSATTFMFDASPVMPREFAFGVAPRDDGNELATHC
jgi:hypothetical protein